MMKNIFKSPEAKEQELEELLLLRELSMNKDGSL